MRLRALVARGGGVLRAGGLALLVAGVVGCAGRATGGGHSQVGSAGASRATTTVKQKRRHRRRHRTAVHGRSAGLAVSGASDQAVQTQSAPGSCHAIGHGVYSRPDPRCTPGALNPEVRQSNIAQTICVPGWTATVRPPESITEPEKRGSLAAYGVTGPLSDYEYDHLVPLELGGATNDRRNLWPEPGGSPNPKDTVELDLHDRVCSGQISLAQARRKIATDWTRLTGGGRGGAPTQRAVCSVQAGFSFAYHDYDVYVRSNQPAETVTVTGDGHVRSWHTNADGAADVYFPGGRGAAGRRIDVSVGGARCTGTLRGRSG